MRFSGWRRKAVALAVLGGLAGLARLTMGAGRPTWLVMILLAGFGLRILLAGPGVTGPSLAGPDPVGDSQEPGGDSRYHSDDGSGG